MKSISEFFDFQPADWDTAYFDVKSAKLTLHNAIDQADFQKIKALAAEYRFITITNMDNNPSNNLWISRLGGAFLADVRIEFKRTTGDLPPAPDSRIHIIDGMERNSDVQRIAASSFIHSRFYNDPFLDSAKTKSIYETWVNNAFGKKGRFFLLMGGGETNSGISSFFASR